ncbi:type II toxin-antitoxin system HicA family toxin [Psychrobacter lutiphocae]|uniref:type II toxin-antitoxin system HicA family toxin n=1 Tax=Psychrobacter lutiphocae TaxID=540500 RepID=UPI001D170AC5|nr:type II toxin-antitoxin system HicA family toxin [Psychrobacter lutiphocae]
MVEKKGWVLDRIKGSHYHFKHPKIGGLLTIPFHSSKEVSPGVLRSISKLVGVRI